MSDPVEALILDLLEWIGPNVRPYAEVLDAWRTSCPRLPVWEEANERGFIEQRHVRERGKFIAVSDLGAEFLRNKRHKSLPVSDRDRGPTEQHAPGRRSRA